MRILLFSVVTLLKYNVSTILSPIVEKNRSDILFEIAWCDFLCLHDAEQIIFRATNKTTGMSDWPRIDKLMDL